MNLTYPVKLYTGRNCVWEHREELDAIGRKALLVTGKSSAQKCGALGDAKRALDDRGIASVLWDGVTPNPTVEECRIAGEVARQNGCDFILGIGGGSPMDAAKAIAVFAANEGLDEAALYAKSWKSPPLPIVLIGTTAGTGSEVTRVSVLTSSGHRKKSVAEDQLLATLSLGDAAYTATLPKYTRLSAGLDAVMHCLESYFSKKASDASRTYATEGIRLAFPILWKLAHDEALTENEQDELYEASIQGGIALFHTGACFPHRMGYWLTENYDVPHGFACAYFIEDLLWQANKFAPDQVQRLEAETGLSCDQLVQLRWEAIPAKEILVSPAEMDGVVKRWPMDDGNLQNTVGSLTPKEIRGFMDKFVRGD